MKTISLFALIVFTTINCVAQTPQLPSNPPNPNQRDPGKLRLLNPPDLLITDMHLVSFIHSVSSGAYSFKVSVSSKNAGELLSAAGKLRAWVKTATGPWVAFGLTANIGAINPGEILIGEYSFKDREKLVASGPFDLKIQVDHGNTTRESSETNNYSTIIHITPADY